MKQLKYNDNRRTAKKTVLTSGGGDEPHGSFVLLNLLNAKPGNVCGTKNTQFIVLPGGVEKAHLALNFRRYQQQPIEPLYVLYSRSSRTRRQWFLFCSGRDRGGMADVRRTF